MGRLLSSLPGPPSGDFDFQCKTQEGAYKSDERQGDTPTEDLAKLLKE